MSGIRIGDAEREHAMTELGRHYAEGRLDHDEYDERLDAIGTARTAADLAMLFDDLPAPTTARLRPEERRVPQTRRRGPRFGFVAVLAVVAAAVLLGAPWLLFVALGVFMFSTPRGSCRRHQSHHRVRPPALGQRV